jgi:hypothetical protein
MEIALPPVLASHYTDVEMKESEGLYRSFRFLKKALLGLAVVLVGLVLFG